MKKLLRWTRELLTATSTGSSTTQLKELPTDRPVSWLTWENNRWTSTFRPLREDTTTTKLWLRILFNLSCFPTFREVDWQRRFSSSKGDSKRQLRSQCTLLSPRQLLKWWKKSDFYGRYRLIFSDSTKNFINHFFLLFLLTGFIWNPKLLPGASLPLGRIIEGGMWLPFMMAFWVCEGIWFIMASGLPTMFIWCISYPLLKFIWLYWL